ncbi:glutamine amidotransferase class-I [Klebsiella pneumoniae]|uniref:Glutamine amidotransferase class-I n=1 Tax=Klebsiella pneumoniae TaxID=573 RepID=A0A378B5T0_KLEPN|nr:glutamine amidotransferase class-I [Klebsiella pneumoniae]
MTRNRLLLVQTGTPPTAIRQAHGDLPRWFRTLLAPWQTQLTTVRVFEDEPLPTPDNQTIAVLTGSWAMVTDRLAWSERTADWIRQAVAIDMPLFGVCYGHQLMAHALGDEEKAMSILIAFLGGMLTLLSPCTLPVIPLLFASVRGRRGQLAIMLAGMALMFGAVSWLVTVASGWVVNLTLAGRGLALAFFTLVGLSLLSQRVAQRLTSPLVALGESA